MTQLDQAPVVQDAREPAGWATIQNGNVVDLTLHKPRAPGDAGWQYYSRRGYSAPQPVYLDAPTLSPGLVAVLLERQRQITSEGWTPEHDDQYTAGQLLKGAAVYLLKAAGLATLRLRPFWPFAVDWLKADDANRNIEKGFALLLAELDRRERLESRGKTHESA